MDGETDPQMVRMARMGEGRRDGGTNPQIAQIPQIGDAGPARITDYALRITIAHSRITSSRITVRLPARLAARPAKVV